MVTILVQTLHAVNFSPQIKRHDVTKILFLQIVPCKRAFKQIALIQRGSLLTIENGKPDDNLLTRILYKLQNDGRVTHQKLQEEQAKGNP